ncbi:MAG: hypothetical protein ACM3WV_09465 [Bacillota bacterium]
MYKHTQIGWTIIIVLGLVLFLTYGGMIRRGTVWIWFAVLAAGVLMSALTVGVDEKYIRLRFGPGLIRRTFKLESIESCRPVKNWWFAASVGIHFGSGSLYNVHGPHAVELTMKSGRKIYVGTDEPEKLAEAIKGRIKGS